MKEIRLLVYFIVGLLLGINSVLAFAALEGSWWDGNLGPYNAAASYPSPQATCDALQVKARTVYPSYPNLVLTAVPTADTWQWVCNMTGGSVPNYGGARLYSQCPSGQTWQSGACVVKATCTGDQKLNAAGTGCECNSGTNYSGYVPATGTGTFACFNGCESLIGSASNQYAVAGQQVWKGSWSSTGSTCQSGTPGGTVGSLPGADSTACSGNQVPGGTVNGKTLCVDPSSSNPLKNTGTKSTDTTDPTGAKTTQKQTTTTSCNGDKCDTTTTTQGPGGTTTTQTGQGQSSYCADNPNAPMCKAQDDKDFCKNNPDALMCQKPALTKGTAGKFEDMAAKVSDAKAGLSTALSQVRSEASSLFGSVSTGGGSGALNFGSFAFMNAHISLDLSQFADALSQVGNAVILMATFFAAFIMFG